MVTIRRRAERAPFAATVGVMFAAVAAALVAATPSALLAGLLGSGSVGARVVVALLAALLVYGVLRLLLIPLASWIEGRSGADWRDEGYVDNEIDSPPAAARRPIFAPAELGAPLMSDAAIAGLADLDRPLAVSDFEADAITRPSGESIATLIDRLERGLARRLPGGGDDPDGSTPPPVPPGPDGDPLDLSTDWMVDDQRNPEHDRDPEEPSAFSSSMRRYAWR